MISKRMVVPALTLSKTSSRKFTATIGVFPESRVGDLTTGSTVRLSRNQRERKIIRPRMARITRLKNAYLNIHAVLKFAFRRTFNHEKH
jgi:hypothetical protein